MIITATTHLLKLSAVAVELSVAERTVQDWVYGEHPVLGSFTKGSVRRVSLEDLTKFILLNTLNPRRPEWLTAPVESNFQEKLREMTRLVCQAEFQKFRLEMMNEGIAA
jgi:hypothetical protein